MTKEGQPENAEENHMKGKGGLCFVQGYTIGLDLNKNA